MLAVNTSIIIPDEYQSLLLYWRDQFSKGYFEIGDIAGELCELAAKQDFRITEQEVFEAVGLFCGKSGRTVRYYYETARFFPVSVRLEFMEVSFSHFVFARSMGNRWREVLSYANENPWVTEDSLRSKFLKLPRDYEDVDKPVSSDNGDGQAVEEGEEPVTEKRRRLLYSISNLQTSLSCIRRDLQLERLQDGTREEVMNAMQTLEFSIPLLISAVDQAA